MQSTGFLPSRGNGRRLFLLLAIRPIIGSALGGVLPVREHHPKKHDWVAATRKKTRCEGCWNGRNLITKRSADTGAFDHVGDQKISYGQSQSRLASATALLLHWQVC